MDSCRGSFFREWQAILEDQPECFVALSVNTGILWRNKAWRKVRGTTRTEDDWVTARALMYHKDHPKLEDAIEHVLRTRKPIGLIVRYKLDGHNLEPWRVTAYPTHCDEPGCLDACGVVIFELEPVV